MINLTRWNIMSIKLIKSYAWIIHVEISTVNDTFLIIIENGKVEIQFIIKFLNKIKIKFYDKRIIVQGWIINLINSNYYKMYKRWMYREYWNLYQCFLSRMNLVPSSDLQKCSNNLRIELLHIHARIWNYCNYCDIKDELNYDFLIQS